MTCRPCRSSMLPCRRWRAQFWISVVPWTCRRVPQRLVERCFPQMVEQLVEVPTILSYSLLQRTTEQHVDIPVPHGCVQGSLPGQSSTAISSGKRISERTVEQIVDIPSPGGSLAHGSSSSAGSADEDFTRVFRTFPRGKKVRVPPRVRVRECLRTRAHGRRRLIRRPVAPTSGCRCVTLTFASPITGTGALVYPPGLLLRASRSSGLVRRESPTSGTGTRASLRIHTLLFLLSEELRRQPRAVYKYWAPCCAFSSAPRNWHSLIRCSLWFDSGYILRQSTAAWERCGSRTRCACTSLCNDRWRRGSSPWSSSSCSRCSSRTRLLLCPLLVNDRCRSSAVAVLPRSLTALSLRSC